MKCQLSEESFGKIDRCQTQAFPHLADEILGDCSCLILADFGQLPLVMDLPLYSKYFHAQPSLILGEVYFSFWPCSGIELTRQSGGYLDKSVPRHTTSLQDFDIWLRTTNAHTCPTWSSGTVMHYLWLRPIVESIIEHNVIMLIVVEVQCSYQSSALRTKCFQMFLQWCIWSGFFGMLVAWSTRDANFQPLDWRRGERCNGYCGCIF